VEFGNANVGEAFLLQAYLEGLLNVVFAVNDEEGFHLLWILAGEELAEVFVVTMGTHAADAADFGVDFMMYTKDVDFFCTGHEAAAE
jgi:hypothetical protein